MTSEMEKKIKAVRAGRQLNVRQEMKKIEDIFEETCEKNHPDVEVLTIIQGIGTVPREQSGREIIYDKNSLTSYKFVKKGDFIIHLRSFEGGLEVANSDGIVSPAYIILHPKIEVSTIYLYALFHTNRFINQTMAPAVEGARDGRSVKYDVLKKQKIPFPPLSEQKKIAEILATQDRVIELKEKLIAEKQSQKKYLMSVLLGDDFKKPFKLNGVIIDKKKWEKKNIDSVSSINGRIGFRGYTNNDITTKEEGVLSLSPSNILNNRFVEDHCTYITEMKYEESPEIQIRNNDIIFVKTGSTFGKTAYLSSFFSKATINPQLVIIRSNGLILQELLAYILQTPYFQKKVKQITVGGAVPTLSQEQLSNIIIHFPSILTEQKAIADVLSAADEEISLLQKDLEQEKLKKKSLMQLLLTGFVRVKV